MNNQTLTSGYALVSGTYGPTVRKLPQPRRHRFEIAVQLNEGMWTIELRELLQAQLDAFLAEKNPNPKTRLVASIKVLAGTDGPYRPPGPRRAR